MPMMIDNLMARVDVNPCWNHGCWMWTGARSGKRKAPYGAVRVDGARNPTAAHVVFYVALVGPIPAGLELDHLCRNTLCVNPEHLEPVTHAVNVRRGMARQNGAFWRERTHCANGHAFTQENTRLRYGTRLCRACDRAKAQRHYYLKTRSSP